MRYKEVANDITTTNTLFTYTSCFSFSGSDHLIYFYYNTILSCISLVETSFELHTSPGDIGNAGLLVFQLDLEFNMSTFFFFILY
jgi:hypothetical protein